jgi:hypothetical protein
MGREPLLLLSSESPVTKAGWLDILPLYTLLLDRQRALPNRHRRSSLHRVFGCQFGLVFALRQGDSNEGANLILSLSPLSSGAPSQTNAGEVSSRRPIH